MRLQTATVSGKSSEIGSNPFGNVDSTTEISTGLDGLAEPLGVPDPEEPVLPVLPELPLSDELPHDASPNINNRTIRVQIAFFTFTFLL